MVKRTLDVKVWSIGNSLVVTIPKLIAKEVLKINEGDIIQITFEKQA